MYTEYLRQSQPCNYKVISTYPYLSKILKSDINVFIRPPPPSLKKKDNKSTSTYLKKRFEKSHQRIKYKLSKIYTTSNGLMIWQISNLHFWHLLNQSSCLRTMANYTTNYSFHAWISAICHIRGINLAADQACIIFLFLNYAMIDFNSKISIWKYVNRDFNNLVSPSSFNRGSV